MDEKTFMGYFFGTIGALVFAALAISSGALPYALAGGGLASGATFFLSRELRFALIMGGGVALAISAIGVGLMFRGG